MTSEFKVKNATYAKNAWKFMVKKCSVCEQETCGLYFLHLQEGLKCAVSDEEAELALTLTISAYSSCSPSLYSSEGRL